VQPKLPDGVVLDTCPRHLIDPELKHGRLALRNTADRDSPVFWRSEKDVEASGAHLRVNLVSSRDSRLVK
jgi:hypothetical protein